MLALFILGEAISEVSTVLSPSHHLSHTETEKLAGLSEG